MCFPFRKTVLQGQIQKLKSFLDVAHLHLAGNSRKTSITGRLVPGHPYGHPKQWDAVKDLPKWDRCWDRCWGGLELKYTWNILKRGFYFGSWWFWCSSKGAVSWYVRNQWTPQDGWELLDDCSWSNDANDASFHHISYVYSIISELDVLENSYPHQTRLENLPLSSMIFPTFFHLQGILRPCSRCESPRTLPNSSGRCHWTQDLLAVAQCSGDLTVFFSIFWIAK